MQGAFQVLVGAGEEAAVQLAADLPRQGDDAAQPGVEDTGSHVGLAVRAAGVPLVESLDSVGGAAGNYVYKIGTRQIQSEVSTGTSLTNAMQNSSLFPNMVIQMVAIGEESGALDSMLGKVADFYEQEVDDAVASLSSLMEPIIMVVLGTLIGGMVIAMYLPIFKLGGVV